MENILQVNLGIWGGPVVYNYDNLFAPEINLVNALLIWNKLVLH